MGGGEGREGDWECGSCRNRNYGFRSLCNRCKQPRLLVDTKTPADSKWLPRIGDWICSGCSNNNYASREQCKKCGQPKEEAAMPLAMAMPGASSFPTYANYFARTQGLLGLRMNYGMMGSLQQSLSQYSSWPYAGANKYGLQSGSSWPVAGNSSGYSYGQDTNAGVPKGWRSGDWLCECGFHNYSSRTECKKCSAPASTGATSSSVARTATSDLFPTLGTKRLASEEFINDWDNKRLNAGDLNTRFLGFEHLAGNDISGIYSKYPSGSSAATSNIGMHIQSPQQGITPAVEFELGVRARTKRVLSRLVLLDQQQLTRLTLVPALSLQISCFCALLFRSFLCGLYLYFFIFM